MMWLLRFLPEIEPGDTAMKTGIVRWVMAASVAAGVGLAPPKAAGAAATFVDAAAWQAAAAGVPGFRVQTMPAIAPERITMSDKFGSWTLAERDNVSVTYQVEGPPSIWPRSNNNISHPSGFLGVRSEAGFLELGFGCHSPVFPCLGMQVAELRLQTPIRGFAGHLRYFTGMAIGSFGRDGLITMLEGVEEPLRPLMVGSTFDGFYGVLFDAPVTMLRFAWQEDFNTDDGAAFRFSNMVMIGVPEPALVASFAALLLLLVLLAHGRAPAMRAVTAASP